MLKKDAKTAPSIRVVYSTSVEGNIITADVVHETSKQMQVRRRGSWGWVSRVPKDTSQWHPSKRAALEWRAAELLGRIETAKANLQQQRTWFGMVEGELSRLVGEPPAAAAVDPSASNTGNPSTREKGV